MAEEKLFTQEEVNKIVQDRLAKDRATRGSTDPVTAAQIEDLTKRLELAESQFKSERSLRIENTKATSLMAALERNHAANPKEIAKILKSNIVVKDDDSISFVADDGKEYSVADGVDEWSKANPWAIRCTMQPGSGAGLAGRGNYDSGAATREAFGLPTCK